MELQEYAFQAEILKTVQEISYDVFLKNVIPPFFGWYSLGCVQTVSDSRQA